MTNIKMTNIKMTTVGIVLALTLGATLVGCTPQDVTEPTPKPSTSAEPTAPSETEAPAQDYEVGANVDPETPLAKGQKAYPLPDGTYVVVDKTQPLPPAVQADLNAKTATKMVGHTDGTVNQQENLATMGQAVGEVAKTTGKRVIAVFKIFGYPSPDSAKVNFYTIMGGPGASTYYTNRADAEAAVNNWLATADNAETYAVVWSD